MTQHQKKVTAIWTIAAVFTVVLSLAAYAFLTDSGRGRQTADTGRSVPTLDDIIASRQSWDPEFKTWFGRPAGDLAVKDIGGNVHNLSDYKGKNVVVVFWATWCPACNMEIPHLIKLREKYDADNLQIIAVSNEPVETLKPFVDAKNINYTVATFTGPLPPPFDSVRGIPTSFFIDPDGNLKLAVVGLVSLEDTIDIINAP